jgi:hypothetical protein
MRKVILTAVLISTCGAANTQQPNGTESSNNEPGSAPIERFHQLYNLEDYQRIYAEYDDEYTAEMSLQRHVEQFRSARKSMGRFISATSVKSKSETRHGENVFVVTELARFECGTVPEEFVFKRTDAVGGLLAYKFVPSCETFKSFP